MRLIWGVRGEETPTSRHTAASVDGGAVRRPERLELLAHLADARAIGDLLRYVLVRDPAARPRAGDVCARAAACPPDAPPDRYRSSTSASSAAYFAITPTERHSKFKLGF